LIKTSTRVIKYFLINPNKYLYLQNRVYASSLMAMSLLPSVLCDCVTYKRELRGGYILPEKLGNFSLNFIVTEIMLFSGLILCANIYSFIIYIEAKMLWPDVNLFENLVAVNKYLFIPTQIYFEKWDMQQQRAFFICLKYLSPNEYVISTMIFDNQN